MGIRREEGMATERKIHKSFRKVKRQGEKKKAKRKKQTATPQKSFKLMPAGSPRMIRIEKSMPQITP